MICGHATTHTHTPALIGTDRSYHWWCKIHIILGMLLSIVQPSAQYYPDMLAGIFAVQSPLDVF